MYPIIGAGLISAAGSITSGIVNNAISRRNAREARDWQEDMWNKQIIYNSPAAQAERLAAAGLNPREGVGFQPAGSAGSAPVADTVPLGNPVSSALEVMQGFKLMELQDAQIGRTLSESEKILQEVSNLQLAYVMGLLEKEEFDYRFNLYKEAYDSETNPFKAEYKKLLADITNIESSAIKNYSDAELNFAKTATENYMREINYSAKAMEAALNSAKATTENYMREITADNLKAQTSNFLNSADKLLKESNLLSDEASYSAYCKEAIRFFGFDPRILSPAVQASFLNAYKSYLFAEDDQSKQAALSDIENLWTTVIPEAIYKEIHLLHSYSGSQSASVGLKGLNGSTSSSFTY